MQHDLCMTIMNCLLLTKNGWFPKNTLEEKRKKGEIGKKLAGTVMPSCMNDNNYMISY